MGAVIDQHAAPGRGLGPEEYARDAIIHWNGPKVHRGDDLIMAALNMHFGGRAGRGARAARGSAPAILERPVDGAACGGPILEPT
jgi:hypothetical protein